MLTAAKTQFVRSALLLAAASCFASAQTEPMPNISELLERASERSSNYVETFRNLMAEEKKTFELFGGDGALRRRRVVESNFIVYPLSLSDGRFVEYRHVTAVDGKKIEGAESRSQLFFERLVKVASSAKELERIQKESFRFDFELQVNGFTLFQAIPLSPNIRSVLEFEIAGNEAVDGANVLVLLFRQTRSSPYIRINRGDRDPVADPALSMEIDDDSRKPLNERIRGQIWLDAVTYQVRREIREVTVMPEGFPEPVLVSRTELVYQPSEFGILTPLRITHEFYKFQRKQRASFREVLAIFEYSKFSKPDVEVRSAEITN